MPYGKFNIDQMKAVVPFLRDAHVHDLGAGTGELSRQLVQLGARQVTLVDKAPHEDWRTLHLPTYKYVVSYFQDYKDKIETAFISWPWTGGRETGLTTLAKGASTVIYMGKNTDGTACGSSELYQMFAGREILAHVPAFKNTLTVYGPRRVKRDPTGEEMAGLMSHTGRAFTYEEAETIVKRTYTKTG